MAKDKQTQIPLVSPDGTTQPPFPGGWVLAIFDALHSFAPACAARHRLPISPRAAVRIKNGEPVKKTTFDEIQDKLVDLVTTLFPAVSATKGFVAGYVDEYFRLWKSAANIAPHWATAFGFAPECSGVLSRALVRDLVLRLCYLESCDRMLDGSDFEDVELELLRNKSPTGVYTALIQTRKYRGKTSMEKLAEQLNLSDDTVLRRIKRGEELPKLPLLQALCPPDTDIRLLAGIGFIDAVTREIGFESNGVLGECLKATESFLVYHRHALSPEALRIFIAHGKSLLLHPGFESVWIKLPDALWRAHLYNLQFARMSDLAQAYLQFAEPASDRHLTAFFQQAECESNGCPYHWMNKLRERSNGLAFPTPT